MRSKQYEKRLDELGVPYEYVESVELDRINSRVQSRLTTDSTIPEEVRRHRVAAEETGTSQYPPFVLAENGDGGWQLLDGAQREEGFRRAGVMSHDAYVVTSESEEVRRVAAQGINVVHGLPPAEDERLERAKEMVRKGETQAQAAKVWQVSESVLSTDLRADRVETKAIRAGASARMLRKIPKTTKVYANKIKRPPLLKATLETITRCAMDGETARGCIDRVLAAHSDEEALEYLNNQQTTTRPKDHKGPDSRVLSSVSRLMTSIRKNPGDTMPTDAQERVRVACEDLVDVLIDYISTME